MRVTALALSAKALFRPHAGPLSREAGRPAGLTGFDCFLSTWTPFCRSSRRYLDGEVAAKKWRQQQNVAVFPTLCSSALDSLILHNHLDHSSEPTTGIRIRRVLKIDVFSDTCVFSKRVRFLTFDNAAENQNYSLNSCRVKVFQRTGNTHSELQHHCSCRGTCIREGGSDL